MLRAELKVVGGKQHGSTIPLATKKFLVGREQDCQLRPTSESVSRHHCVFSLDDFGVRLRDLGSTNGTFVNGERVQGSVLLQPGDHVLIGKLEFEILILDAVQATQHAKVAVSMSPTDSSAGFMLSDLAEAPEAAMDRATLLDTLPTEILGSSDDSSNETGVMSADRTSVVPTKIPQPNPFAQTLVADGLPFEELLTDESIPVVAAPLPLAPPVAPPMQQMAPGMPMGGMPMQQQPYGMPGYGQQPGYIQAPFSGYAPQYMPSPYGMPQQGYMDPYQQQQMAYQQQMAMQQQMVAQQQMAQQQAMMAAQYAVPAMPDMEPELEEEPSAKMAPPPVTLPPPEETGAKPVAPPPPPAPAAEGAAPAAPAVKPNQMAADILKKYMNR